MLDCLFEHEQTIIIPKAFVPRQTRPIFCYYQTKVDWWSGRVFKFCCLNLEELEIEELFPFFEIYGTIVTALNSTTVQVREIHYEC